MSADVAHNKTHIITFSGEANFNLLHQMMLWVYNGPVVAKLCEILEGQISISKAHLV